MGSVASPGNNSLLPRRGPTPLATGSNTAGTRFSPAERIYRRRRGSSLFSKDHHRSLRCLFFLDPRDRDSNFAIADASLIVSSYFATITLYLLNRYFSTNIIQYLFITYIYLIAKASESIVARSRSAVPAIKTVAFPNRTTGYRFSKTPRRQVSRHLQCRIAAVTSKRLVKQALNDCSYLDRLEIAEERCATKKKGGRGAREGGQGLESHVLRLRGGPAR